MSPFTINVGGDGPTSATNSPVQVSWAPDGSAVKWYFDAHRTNHDIQIGGTSQTLVIVTQAAAYDNLGTVTVQNTATVNLGGFEPLPEPSSLMVTGLGAAGLLAHGLRRRMARTA